MLRGKTGCVEYLLHGAVVGDVTVHAARVRPVFCRRPPSASIADVTLKLLRHAVRTTPPPVSYTHLTLPTIYSV